MFISDKRCHAAARARGLMITGVLVGVAVSVAAAACGDDSSPPGSPDAQPVGVACPAVPPESSDACPADVPIDTECWYEWCGTSDTLIHASCWPGESGPRWAVGYSFCSETTCQGRTCAGGSICVERAGGALIVDCQAHSCGDGPLTCACVCGDGVGCHLGASSQDALFTCVSDCGADQCP